MVSDVGAALVAAQGNYTGCPYVLLDLLAFDDLGLVRAFERVHEESIRAFQPDLTEHVIRHIFRIGRRKVPHHIEDNLRLGKRRRRLREALREGDLEFLARCFLTQRKLTSPSSSPRPAFWLFSVLVFP